MDAQHPPAAPVSPIGRRVQPLLDRLAQRATTAIALLGALMLTAFLGATILFPKPDGQIVRGDATHHYVQLRSLVFDHDVDFRNDYAEQFNLGPDDPANWWLYSDPTPTGLVRNYMPVGPALLALPIHAPAVWLQQGLAGVGLSPVPRGFEPWFQIIPGIVGVLAATMGAWLSWRTALRFTDASSALAGTLAVWLGSHALYYALVSPAYSHSASMFAVSLFCWHWLQPHAPPTVSRAAVSGGLAGLCALMRWQDALLLAVPVIGAVIARGSVRRRVLAAGVAVAAWSVAFSPQMAIWTALYGAPLAIPQGPSFVQWTDPHPVAVLFSYQRGLFTWAPVLLLALPGLWHVGVEQRRWVSSLVVLLAGTWYVNASVADWWAGEAYGARRFLSLFPVFVVGTAVWLGRARPWSRGHLRRLAAVVILLLGNVLFLLQYQVFMKGLRDIAPYPSDGLDFWIVRFLVPFRLLGFWLG